MNDWSKKQLWNKMMEKVSEPIYSSGNYFGTWEGHSRMHAKEDFDFETIADLTQVCNDDERIKLLELLDRIDVKPSSYDRDTNIRYNRMRGDAIYAIVNSFESEDLKINFIKECINYRGNDSKGKKNHIPELIASLDSDEIKIELLQELQSGKKTRFTENRDSAVIIASLSSDEKKLELLEHIGSDIGKNNADVNRAYIIKTINSDEKKIELLSTIEESSIKSDIIASLSTDLEKMKLLDTLDEKDKIGVILSLDSDDIKLEFLNRVSSEEYKDIRKQLIDDDYFLSSKKISPEKKDEAMIENLRFKIIDSLSSDATKSTLIGLLNWWNDQATIVSHMKSPDIKKEFLEQAPKGQQYTIGRKRLKQSIEVDDGNSIGIENDISLVDCIDPLLEQCKEQETEGLEKHNRQVETQRKEEAEREEIRRLSEQNDDIQKQIQNAKSKIEELTRKEELEKSIAAGQKELAELLEVLAKLEANREVE